MEIFISIDGVLRNLIQKFDYHYKDAYLSSEFINENNFNYEVIEPIQNNNLLESYKFNSIEEFEYFLFIEYPIEIFGHAGLSYSNAMSDMNKLIYENPEHTFTLVGLDELGKSKPSSLFFLSKNGFLGNNIKFIRTNEIENMWSKCHLWITDNYEIIKNCPMNKNVIKFNTKYNKHYVSLKQINKLSEINEPWLKFSEKTIS